MVARTFITVGDRLIIDMIRFYIRPVKRVEFTHCMPINKPSSSSPSSSFLISIIRLYIHIHILSFYAESSLVTPSQSSTLISILFPSFPSLSLRHNFPTIYIDLSFSWQLFLIAPSSCHLSATILSLLLKTPPSCLPLSLKTLMTTSFS